MDNLNTFVANALTAAFANAQATGADMPDLNAVSAQAAADWQAKSAALQDTIDVANKAVDSIVNGLDADCKNDVVAALITHLRTHTKTGRGGSKQGTSCADIRNAAVDWAGSRKDFVADMVAKGHNEATVKTQWQIARSGTDATNN